MSIRREDKELIYNLGILGGLLGACLGVFLMIHLSNRAHEQYQKQSQIQQTSEAIVKLSSSAINPEMPTLDQSLLKQVQEQIQQEHHDISENANQSFWLRIPRWGFLGLCGAGGLIGVIAGFSTVWATCWGGSVFTYCFIRLIYKTIRKVAPNSKIAQEQTPATVTTIGSPAFHRDESRILPVLIKLTFLLILVLSVLGMVVWHIAGM